MADGDAATISKFPRALADVIEGHAFGVGAEIEMQVDVDIVFTRELEDAIDLAGRIAVGVRRAADRTAAAIERFDHQFLGAGIVEKPLLRKYADLQIDRPGVLLDKRQDAFEPAQTDAGIDFEVGAHVGGAVEDRLFQRAHRAAVDILGRECRLGLGSFRDRLLEITALGLAAIEDAGLVEMNVRFDESGRDQAAADVDRLTLGRQTRCDRRNPPVGDADVGQFVLGPDAPGVPENDVHGGPSRRFGALRRRYETAAGPPR